MFVSLSFPDVLSKLVLPAKVSDEVGLDVVFAGLFPSIAVTEGETIYVFKLVIRNQYVNTGWKKPIQCYEISNLIY